MESSTVREEGSGSIITKEVMKKIILRQITDQTLTMIEDLDRFKKTFKNYPYGVNNIYDAYIKYIEHEIQGLRNFKYLLLRMDNIYDSSK